MMGMGGGGGGRRKPKKNTWEVPSSLSPGLIAELNAIAVHGAYRRHVTEGLDALPSYREDYSDLKHFGFDIEMRQIANVDTPTFECGLHVEVGFA